MLAQAIRKRLGRAAKEEKGFTLIELLAVIVILGIIAVIAVPMIGNVIEKSRTNSDIATGRQIYDAARMYIIGEESGVFTSKEVSLTKMISTGYLEDGLRLPSSKAPITTVTVKFTSTGVLEKVIIVPKPEGSTSETAGGSYSPAQIMSSEKTPPTTAPVSGGS